MMRTEIEISGRRIGPGNPTYIIAEMSANHAGKYESAVAIIEAASAAGADAVKLQTYTPDTITLDSDAPDFVIRGTPWDGRRLYDLYADAYTPWEWQPKLKQVADRLGLHLFSSPFDESAVTFLEQMGVPAYKIASFEIVDIPLMRRVAATKKPVIVSTGMATLAEIEEAVATLRDSGCTEVALLKCTSAYPAPPDEMNLRCLPVLASAFGVPVGLSDHTPGATVPTAAVALGATIVEKHLTLSRADGGPDASFSMEPAEFRELVSSIRTVERALGRVQFGPGEHEVESRALRRSLYVIRDIRAGDLLTRENVRSIRPGRGLHPRHLCEVLGKPARRDVARGTPLDWIHVG
jgi:N-acetylneuraminate synthase